MLAVQGHLVSESTRTFCTFSRFLAEQDHAPKPENSHGTEAYYRELDTMLVRSKEAFEALDSLWDRHEGERSGLDSRRFYLLLFLT